MFSAVENHLALSERRTSVGSAMGSGAGLGVGSGAGLGVDGEGRTLQLFGVRLYDTTLSAAARWIVASARQSQPTTVAFLNAHCVNTIFRDAAYRHALEEANRIFVDGIGMRIAAKLAGTQLKENVNGTDLLPVLCAEAARSGIGLFLFGGGEGIAAEAARRSHEAQPDLVIAGTHHGYLSGPDEEARVIDAMNASGAGIILVGLGIPAQELWIARNRHRIAAPVVIGVGGLFDYYSGRIARAPLVMRRAGLEWLWRLAMEPRRLANRYILGNMQFIARLAWLKLVASADLETRTIS